MQDLKPHMIPMNQTTQARAAKAADVKVMLRSISAQRIEARAQVGLLAAILFGVALTPIQLAGGALILGGVVIAQTGPGSALANRPAVRLADE